MSKPNAIGEIEIAFKILLTVKSIRLKRGKENSVLL